MYSTRLTSQDSLSNWKYSWNRQKSAWDRGFQPSFTLWIEKCSAELKSAPYFDLFFTILHASIAQKVGKSSKITIFWLTSLTKVSTKFLKPKRPNFVLMHYIKPSKKSELNNFDQFRGEKAIIVTETWADSSVFFFYFLYSSSLTGLLGDNHWALADSK